MTRVCGLLVSLLILLMPALLHGQDVDAVHFGPATPAPERSAPATSVSAFPANAIPASTAAGLSPPYPFDSGTVSRPIFELSRLVRGAGIIFSGYVTSVGRGASPFGRDVGSTAITFRVEHGIRGALAGTDLTIHEWAGLWARGERYRVGDRVLLFLYPFSKLGLTSPVSGALGRFVVGPRGRIVMDVQHRAALSGDPLIREILVTGGPAGRRATLNFNDFSRAVQRAGGTE